MAESFVPLVGTDSQWVNMARRCRILLVLYFFDGFMEEAYEGGLGHDLQIWIRQKAVRTRLGSANLHFGEYFLTLHISLCAFLRCCALGWFEN